MTETGRYEFSEWKPIDTIPDEYAQEFAEARRRCKSMETGVRRQPIYLIEWRDEYHVYGKFAPRTNFVGLWFKADNGAEIFVKHGEGDGLDPLQAFILAGILAAIFILLISRPAF